MGFDDGQVIGHLNVDVDPDFIVECSAAQAMVTDDRVLFDGIVERRDDFRSHLGIECIHQTRDGSTDEGYAVDKNQYRYDERSHRIEPIPFSQNDESDTDAGCDCGQNVRHDVLAVGDQGERVVALAYVTDVQCEGEVDDRNNGGDAEPGAESMQVGAIGERIVSAEEYGDGGGQYEHTLCADGQIHDTSVTVGMSFVGGASGVPDGKRNKYGGDDVDYRLGCVGEKSAAACNRKCQEFAQHEHG